MNERLRALQYGRELVDATWRQDPEVAAAAADELDVLVGATRGAATDTRPLFHPLVPTSRKLATVKALVAGAGISRPTAVLLEALAQFHALHLLPQIAAAFRERLHQKQGVVRAKVTTATRLPEAKAEALAARLARLAGRQVTLETGVDPSIIGGVVTQIGSTVYDGSVTRQLARMRQKLVENV